MELLSLVLGSVVFLFPDQFSGLCKYGIKGLSYKAGILP